MSNPVRDFINHALKGGSLYSIVEDIKNNGSFKDWCAITDNNTPLVKRNLAWFIGNPLPKSYTELGELMPIVSAKDLGTEIDWFFLAIRNHTAVISEFLQLRKEYEATIIRGDLDSAENILDRIEKQTCCSLYTLENRMLLHHLKTGEVDPAVLYDQTFQDDLPQSTRFISYQLALRIPLSTTVPNYKETVLAAFDEYYEDDREQLINYFIFRFNPFLSEDYPGAKQLLEVDFQFSVIDRYLTFVRVLGLFLMGGISFNAPNLIYRLKSLVKKIDDIALLKIISFLQQEPETLNLPFGKDMILANDQYIKGEFPEAYASICKVLSVQPADVGAIKLYGKICVALNKKVEAPAFSDWYQQILNTVCAVYTRKSDQYLSTSKLYKLASVFNSFDLCYGIMDFWLSEIFNDSKLTRGALATSPYPSLEFYRVFDEPGQSKMLNKLAEQWPDSVTFRYKCNIIDGNLAANESLVSGNILRGEILAIDYQLRVKDYDTAILKCQVLLETPVADDYMFEKIIRRLFYAYCHSDLMDDAISHFIKYYFKYSQLTVKFRPELLLSKVRSARFRNVTASLELGIFYQINQAPETEIYNAIELYLLRLGVDRPSVIDPQKVNSRKFLVYFLENVCTHESLQHSTAFESTQELYLERIQILLLLQTINQPKISQYDDEISTIIQKLIIANGVNKLDSSKIYINEEGIYESQTVSVSPDYPKVMSRCLTALNEVEPYDRERYMADRSYVQMMEDRISMAVRPIHEAYVLIKNEFLFGPYGLNNYLSTRIRHGVFEAAIRPVFENLNLVTKKTNSGDRYLPNLYWPQKLAQLHPDLVSGLQPILANFSRVIDDGIEKFLNSYIQIRSEGKNKLGLLNYSGIETRGFITHLVEQQPTLREFFFKIFDFLWHKTDMVLKDVRAYIRNDLFSQFERYISEFEDALLRKGKKEQFEEILRNTSICRTQLHSALETVSLWFVRSDSQMSDTKLGDIIDITARYLNKGRTRTMIELKKHDIPDVMIRGKYYVAMTDLFGIFFDNCLRRSGFHETAIKLELFAEHQHDSVYSLRFINPVSDQIDLEELRAQLAAIRSDLARPDRIMGERNSGFAKARSILKHEFDDTYKKNSLDFFLNEEDMFEVRVVIDIKPIQK